MSFSMANVRPKLEPLFERLPWYVRQVVKSAVRHWHARKPPFAGVYASFSELPKTSRVVGSELAQSARLRALASRASDGPLGLRRLPQSRSLLAASVALLGGTEGPLRVLDFGGAAGADFANVLASVGKDTKLDYQVVDLPEVCEAGRAIWGGDQRISFSPTLPDPTARFDLVYAWGAIHYLEDPVGLLRKFAGYQPKAILLLAHPVAEHAFVRGQCNRSVPFPQWVLGLPAVERALSELGYELRLRFLDDENYNVKREQSVLAVLCDRGCASTGQPTGSSCSTR